MKTSCLPIVCVLSLFCANGYSALVLDENFDYGASNLASDYGSWEDGTSRAQYNASADLSFTNSGYGSDATADTGSFEANNQTGGLRGAFLDVQTMTAGDYWVSMLLELNNSVLDTGLMITFTTNTSTGGSTFNGNGLGLVTTAGGISAEIL